MPTFDVDELERGIRGADRRAIARAITLVESSRADHQPAAAGLLERLARAPGEALRIGLSGAPGVGKSTFIETFGMYLVEGGHRVAVLAVDPSSAVSGGSILGDKTRMEGLARDPRAFIRPTPSGAVPGGVGRRTPETIRIVEAAGFDVVIVETVGVGQSEAAVAAMTDIFVLLLAPGAGDELQGIKRGIVELAHLVLVNKADGEFAGAAQRTTAEYRNALHLLASNDADWSAEVHPCSALTGVRSRGGVGLYRALPRLVRVDRRPVAPAFGAGAGVVVGRDHRQRPRRHRVSRTIEGPRRGAGGGGRRGKGAGRDGGPAHHRSGVRVDGADDDFGRAAKSGSATEGCRPRLTCPAARRRSSPPRSGRRPEGNFGRGNGRMIGRLNHVAIAVPDLAAASATYRDTLGAAVSAPVDMPEHGVTTVFVELPNTKIELLGELGADSPIARFLRRNPGGGIHHVCYEVDDLEASRASLESRGARVLGDGRPRIGAHGKPVLFLHPKDFCGTLVELEQV